MILKLWMATLLTLSALANFNGKWLGEGYYYTHKSEGECHEVFFELQEDKDYFRIKTGGYNCSFMSAEYPSSHFKKKGEELFYNGKKVGTIKDNQVSISYYDGVYKLDLMIDGKQLIFREDWAQDGSYLRLKSHLSRYVD